MSQLSINSFVVISELQYKNQSGNFGFLVFIEFIEFIEFFSKN
jgi:hypothetical protein